MSKGKKANPVRGLELMVTFVFTMIFLVIADQFIKFVVDFEMEYQSTIPIVENFFSLHYVRNTGSAFSFLADKEWGITVLTAISAGLGALVVVLMGIASRKNLKLLGFAFCLIASGAFGNLVDRVHLKYVIDYLRFDFGNYTFPIFNLADICAVLGTVILMLIILFGHKYLDAFWGSSEKKKEKARKAEVKMPEQPENEEDPGSEDEDADHEDDLEEEQSEVDDAEPDSAPEDESVPAIPYKDRPGNIVRNDGED